MKRWKKWFSVLLCIAFAFSAMCMGVRADAPTASYTPPASYREHFSQSEQAAFEQILEETDAKSRADWVVEHAEADGTCRVGLDEWFAVYSFYGSFEELADASDEDFFDKLSDDPALYVPIYRCPEGEHERLIGCVVVSKWGTLGEEIRYRPKTMMYGEQQGHTPMPDRIGTFAKAQKVGERYGLQSVSHAVAVSAPNPYCGLDNTLLLLQADGVWYVYDFEDSLTLEAADFTERFYTLEEYIDLRAKLEKSEEPSPAAYIVIAAVALIAWVAVNLLGTVICIAVLELRARKKRKAS